MTAPAIVVQDLRKAFGDVTALDGLSFEVGHGQVFALLGRNGAGKTTTVRILTTNLRPDSGSAKILGFDTATDSAEARLRIGLAGQYAAVDDNLTGRENLRLIGRLTRVGRTELRSRTDELLATFGLEGVADRQAKTYSGGMRRRLDIAAALIHRPPVVFLDEPTTGLDPQSRLELWELIRRLVSDGSTVLLTTQYLDEADRLADRIAVLDDGALVADGTPAQLKAQLGTSVVEVGFADAAEAERAEEALRDLANAEPQRDGRMVRLPAHDARLVMDVLTRVNAQGLAPATVALREPSLDDVFLTLTGRGEQAAIADSHTVGATK